MLRPDTCVFVSGTSGATSAMEKRTGCDLRFRKTSAILLLSMTIANLCKCELSELLAGMECSNQERGNNLDLSWMCLVNPKKVSLRRSSCSDFRAGRWYRRYEVSFFRTAGNSVSHHGVSYPDFDSLGSNDLPIKFHKLVRSIFWNRCHEPSA